jgi:AraC family ethanolamine operon transcriptional activator
MLQNCARNAPLLTLPQPNYLHRESQDFDEQSQFLQGWHQDYSQLSAGHFNGFLTHVHLPQVSLFLEFTNQQLHQQGYLDEEKISIGVPMNSIEKGMFCGSLCEQQAVHIFSGRNGFELVSPANLTIGLIVISRKFLMQYLSDDDQERLDQQCQSAKILYLSQTKYQNLVRFLRSVFATLKALPGFIQYPTLVQETQMMALQMVADTLLCDDSAPRTVYYQNQSWQVVTKTRKIVRQRQDDPISVVELCESLAMSHRTLQYHFQRTLEKSPVVYLRTERLNGVRQMLRHANSVTEAATSWGFWHFGHFSQEYKKMFGEAPSTTFKRFHE